MRGEEGEEYGLINIKISTDSDGSADTPLNTQ